MTDDQKTSSQTDTDASSADGKKSNNNESVSRESFLKSVEQEKNARKRAQELEAKVKAYEQRELEEKGQYSAIIKQKEDELEKLKAKTETQKQAFTSYLITSAVKNKALESGAMPEAVDLILKAEDWSSVSISDDLTPNESEIEEKIGKLSKSKSFLFSKKGGQVNDVTLNSTKSSKKAYKDMTREELAEEFKRLK